MFDSDPENPFGSLTRPFWFVPAGGLLELFWQAEAKSAAALAQQYPEAAELLDSAEATLGQRHACLSLLFWGAVLELIFDRFGAAYRDAPALPKPVQSRVDALFRLRIPADAPDWALEVQRALHGIPGKIMGALPPALQQAGGDPNDSKRIAEIRAAQQGLDTPERLHEMLDGVLQTQWQRLARRWNAAAPAPPPVAAAENLPTGFRHGPDFKSVHWAGKNFTFTPRQAQAVQMLHAAWRDRTPEIGQDAILENLGTLGRDKIGKGKLPPRLRDLFRNNPAWGALIVQGGRRGTYRLALPPRGKRTS